MASPSVLVLGGGIAGLTAAHELAERGMRVQLVERYAQFGGLAKSERDAQRRPTEHSWRGLAPFYENTFELLKRIPSPANGGSVYGELSRPIRFFLPKDRAGTDSAEVPMSLRDKATLYPPLFRAFASCAARRQRVHAAIPWTSLVGNRLSETTYDRAVRLIGPALGLDLDRASLHHVARFIEIERQNLPGHTHTDAAGTYHNPTDGTWHVMRRPTHEAWFEPWLRHLHAVLGVETWSGRTARSIVAGEDGSSIASVQVAGPGATDSVSLSADAYICAVAPTALAELVGNSGSRIQAALDLPRLARQAELGRQDQISFHLFFDRPFALTAPRPVIVLPDSPWVLTILPCEQAWDRDVDLGEGVLGIWSGVICQADVPGRKYGKPASRCRPGEIIDEIIEQITNCGHLQQMLAACNGGARFEDARLVHATVWSGWQFDEASGMLTTDEPKWGCTVESEPLRDGTDTPFANLFLAGAHIRNSLDIFSMEAAVESGKRAAERVRSQLMPSAPPVRIHTHGPLRLFSGLRWLDKQVDRLMGGRRQKRLEPV